MKRKGLFSMQVSNNDLRTKEMIYITIGGNGNG